MNQDIETTTLYYELNKDFKYTDRLLERLSKDLIRNDYKDYSHKPLLHIYFYSTDLKEPDGVALFKDGSFVLSEWFSKKQLGSVGIVISNSIKDLESEYRLGVIRDYLRTAYIQGQDFLYRRIDYQDEQLEHKKLSDKLKIRNTNKITGEECLIQKSAEHSKEFDGKFLLRLEDNAKIGANEIHIRRDIIKAGIELLIKEHYIVLRSWLYPDRIIPGYQKKQRDYWETYEKAKQRKRNKAINALIDILVDK